VLVGKTGIHADAELDIGGNAENLLRNAPCHVWLGEATYTPPFDAVARETIAWTEEAEGKMELVPEAARDMVRTAILRFAQESGHTVITSGFIDEATERFCPARAGGIEGEDGPAWSDAAARLVDAVGDPGTTAGIRLRAEKRARREGAAVVAPEHVRPFLDPEAAPAPAWSAGALARLARVPELVRTSVRGRIEALAQEAGVAEVTLEIAETAIAESRRAMDRAMRAGGHTSDRSDGGDHGQGD
jgi:hypothetical protein